MKVFIDEDCGTGIPKSLKLVKMPSDDIVYPSNHPPIRFGTKDPEWLRWVGENRYLALSSNHKILENANEFPLILQYQVGIVFVDNGEYPTWACLRMFMNRWEWLQAIDRTERPFVYLVGLAGKPVPYDLTKGLRPPRPLRQPALHSVAPAPPLPRPGQQIQLL